MTALLSWENHVDASATVISASSQAGDLAPSNLADPIVGRRLRSTALSLTLDFDFGSNRNVGVIALVFPRDTMSGPDGAVPGGTVRHTLDADGGTPGAGVAHDSAAVQIGLADGYGYHLYMPPATVSARYWRASFSATGVSFVDIGRAWAGDAWQPTYDVSGGYEEIWDDRSNVSVARRSGAEYVDVLSRQRQYAFGLDALSKAERDNLREMQRVIGLSSQLLFCLDPSEFARETVLGRLESSQPIRHRALSVNLYQRAFVIRESI